jgi:DNA-binding NarL/FixJ family response regulator
MPDEYNKEILKRFDAVIKLLTLTAMKEETQKKKIILLDSVGFKPKEIADLLSTTNNTVSVALSNIKRKDKESEKSDANVNENISEMLENKEDSK